MGQDTERSFETIDGTRIHTLRAPRPGAPRVLLLAPWPQTLVSFRAAWPSLTRSLDVTAIDLPGFGHSEAPREPTSPSSLARFLLLVLDHFELDRAHVVGTDVGVPVALSFAEEHPERLASLVLSDGPGTVNPTLHPDLDRMVSSRFYRWFFGLSAKLFVRTAVSNGYRSRQPSPDEVDDFVEAHRASGRLRGTLDFLATYPKELAAIDAGLGRVSTPTLLLWGQRDVYVPPENATALKARLKNSEVRLLAGAGHFSHDDDPEGYASAVVEWCLRHEAR
jgi:pimeloyl-ACP methyl ester carboxylesterase